MEKTKLNFNKPFWCIVCSGHTYKDSDDMETCIYQFDTATKMSDFLGEGSINEGESEGTFIFSKRAMSHSWKFLNQQIEFEKEISKIEEQAILEAEANAESRS